MWNKEDAKLDGVVGEDRVDGSTMAAEMGHAEVQAERVEDAACVSSEETQGLLPPS